MLEIWVLGTSLCGGGGGSGGGGGGGGKHVSRKPYLAILI